MIMATEGGQTDRQKDRQTNTVTFILLEVADLQSPLKKRNN